MKNCQYRFFKQENNVGISLRQISEGQLLKYTNMMKGWQNRWFVLDPHTGMLEYFMVILKIVSLDFFTEWLLSLKVKEGSDQGLHCTWQEQLLSRVKKIHIPFLSMLQMKTHLS
jgi:hypothetical protein